MKIKRVTAEHGVEFMRYDQSWSNDKKEASNFSDKLAYEFVDKAINRGELNIYLEEDTPLEKW